MLTAKQKTLITYLQGYYGSHGVMPSYDEMAVALDLRSKSGIHRLIAGLEERGRIRRLPNRARAIELVERPVPGADQVPWAGEVGPGRPIPKPTARLVTVPDGVLGPGEHYAVTVRDGAMAPDGILDGDVAVIHRQDFAPGHGFALVSVVGEGVFLRRLRLRGATVALLPGQSGQDAWIVAKERALVLGRLASILRDYR